jgi:serine/threonine-protein kinase
MGSLSPAITVAMPPSAESAAIGPPTEAAVEAGPTLGRYVDRGFLGQGASGELRRVYDPTLRREMAMKILRAELAAVSQVRFVQEARITAQLQHPGIVPVHEIGRLDDGRVYFTMKEVRGHTLDIAVREAHTGGLRRPGLLHLIDIFRTVCATIAFAHARGVIHRDLKPANIMVGEFDEVQVMDWGLGKVIAPTDRTVNSPVHVDFSGPGLPEDSAGQLTLLGQIAGTPAYMAPEQAFGQAADSDCTTDVYALGAVLYEILAGCAPYQGNSASSVVRQVQAGPPTPLTATPAMPTELVELCTWAMSREPNARPADAGVMAREITRWLEGERAQQRADALVAEAQALRASFAPRRAAAQARRAAAQAALAQIPGFLPADMRRAAWRELDAAAAEEQSVELDNHAIVERLQAALQQAPDHAGARRALVEVSCEQLLQAEAAGALGEVRRLSAQIRAHDDGAAAAWLRGDGRLSLQTTPPGARVTLLRYEARDRRLELDEVGELGQTPILDHPLARGSYLARIEHPGFETVLYPISIGREQRWDGQTPEGAACPIALPPAGSLGPGEVYVPAGWFESGESTDDFGPRTALPRRRLWLDGFVIQSRPVSNTEYLIFLNDLLAQGRAEEAERYAPREMGSGPMTLGPLIYGRTPDGQFCMGGPNAYGISWEPGWPILNVDHFAATAYAAWYAARTGQPWRLPWEMEWEKAARGVDGRRYPWGNEFDPAWCHMLESHGQMPLPARVDAPTLDQSPYGVVGLAGNAQEFCADVIWEGGPPVSEQGRVLGATPILHWDIRVTKGGGFLDTVAWTRAGLRRGVLPFAREHQLSFRLARPFHSTP